MVVCDGLKGLPDAVTTVWDKAIVQTCVVHLLTELVGVFLQFRVGGATVLRHDRVRGAAEGSGGVGRAVGGLVDGDRRCVGAVAAA